MKPSAIVPTLLLPVAAAFSGPAVHVDPGIPAFFPSSAPLSGAFHAIGSDAMRSVTERWEAILVHAHPGVVFTYDIEKNFNSIPGLGDGRAQFAPLGRLPSKPEYVAFVEETGYPPSAIRVSNCTYGGGPNKDWPHPHAVFVNRDNPLSRLTLAQVDAIFSKTRRRGYPVEVTKWGQLGLTGDWADRPIVLYGVNGGEGNRGPANFFRERALGSGVLKELHGAKSEEFVVPMIAADRFGIGFTGLPFETPGVKHLALAENESAPYSDASLKDVVAGKYPLSRVTYVHFDRPPGMPVEPVLKELLRVALSREGQEAAIAEGYLPLSAEDAAKERAKLE